MENDEKKVDGAQNEGDPDGDGLIDDSQIYGGEEEKSDEKKSDGADGQKGGQEADGTKSNRAKDSHYAELRRKNEELAKENERLKSEAKKAEFAGKASAVPKYVLEDLGLDSIDTEENLKLANAFLEAEANGSADPKGEAYKKMYDEMKAEESKKQKEAEAAAKEKEEGKKALIALKSDFIKEFGEEEYKSQILDENSAWRKGIGKYASADTLIPMYREYKSSLEATKEAGKQKAMDLGGGFLGQQSAKSSIETNVFKMSEKEFNEYWNKKYRGA